MTCAGLHLKSVNTNLSAAISLTYCDLDIFQVVPIAVIIDTLDDATLVQQYRDGASFATLAATFGRSENAVISRLVRLRAAILPDNAPAETSGGDPAAE